MEVLEMKQFFDQELQKILRLGSDRDRLSSDQPEQEESDDEENVGVPQTVDPPTSTHSRPTSASEELAKLLASAKMDLRDSLKRPQDRFPLSSLTEN